LGRWNYIVRFYKNLLIIIIIIIVIIVFKGLILFCNILKMTIFWIILLVLLVVINIVAFYKVERLIKINKWWFPFFHLVIAYLILWLVTFLVSLFFNFSFAAGFNDQGHTSLGVVWGSLSSSHMTQIGVGDYHSWMLWNEKMEYIQSSIMYILSLIGLLIPLLYIMYLFTRLWWLKWYFSILWVIPIVNFFYYPYLYLRISKKFKKWVGSALLLFFFEPIYFPILILKDEKNYVWLDNSVSITKKELWIIYWVLLFISISFIVIDLSSKKEYVSTNQRAFDVARKANFSTISTALTMYFNDQWEYPKSLWNTLTPDYLMDIPTDPITNKWYFYRSISCKWTKNAWFVLATKMSNPSDCNVDIYSVKELWKLINKFENNWDTCTKIELTIQTDLAKHNFKEGCYYIEE